MILDERTEFADAAAVGAPNNSTVNVGDIIDTTLAQDQGLSELYLVIQVDTAITSGGAATVAFQLVSDSTTSIAVDGTQTVHFRSKAFAVASLTAGFVAVIAKLPAEGAAYERYLGVQVVETAGQALTAGKINAFLTLDARVYKSYADAVN